MEKVFAFGDDDQADGVRDAYDGATVHDDEDDEDDNDDSLFIDGIVSSRDNAFMTVARRTNNKQRHGRKQTKTSPKGNIRQGDLLTSMEGLIWNANKVMDHALRPGWEGIGKGNFTTCAGICILSCTQVAVSVSGNVGTGIFLRHNVDGSWSNPVACGIVGFGVGISLGATLRDALIFLTDFEAVESFFQRGFRFGGRVNLTCGLGRSAEGHVGASPTGTSASYTISYSHGMDVGASLCGDVVSPRHKINETFYGLGKSDPASIVNGTTPFPDDKVTVIDSLKEKLTMCAQRGRGVSDVGELGVIGLTTPNTTLATGKGVQSLPSATVAASSSSSPSSSPHADRVNVMTGVRQQLLELCYGGPWKKLTTTNKDNQKEIIDKMMHREQELLAQQGHQQGRDDAPWLEEHLASMDQHNGLITSSLIVHVEPDWQSTREL